MFSKRHILTCLIIYVSSFPILTSSSQSQEKQVAHWVDTLGSELWRLGDVITKFSEISESYNYLKARIEKNDLQESLNEVAKDIERMMDRKMDAIRCIVQTAEEAAEAFELNTTEFYQYYSSKYSQVVGENPPKIPKSLNGSMYLPLTLNNDTHFYNLAVDTKHSSVHVPTNIHDRHMEAAVAIQWSEALNNVFTQNYKSDPALSWQYFGSTTGVMRHYPAKKWTDVRRDRFDCRIRTWFIEAATCTKDVVILVDNSGSMDGMGKHIAAFTAYSILDTFSNNDYINVLYYNVTTNYTIPCFEDMLVQATEENIVIFKKAIQELKPAGKTQLSQALVVAFDLLSKYREIRGCNETSRTCNQAIMVVTDGVSKNLSETVIKYNYLSNGDNIPVRLFTYLIGEEVTNVQEIMWMACANRGYHTHVQSLEQVTASVLEYINVIARPLVLQAVEHPVSWTHAQVDITSEDSAPDPRNEPFRLMTSAAVPAFDTKANKNNETRMANLLGVAGTDVPIDDIEKLTLPYKIGVNAYAFIITNNGYVLMHRDLRPLYETKIMDNYNSIDLTEVEQFDNDMDPRELDEELLELRTALLNESTGSMHDISIKYHYDNMRRVSRQKYDYYYTPLKTTPFSIAFAIPSGYGHYMLHVEDEIKKNQHTSIQITDFFQGSNWKIHPKWVYCKYHYLEGHEFDSPEAELYHFLGKMYVEGFVWEKQYEETADGAEENLEHVECGRKTHDDDEYYCDRQLVELLLFDARNTLVAFKEKWNYRSNEEHLFIRYNATLRFVATMSGLTRWEYLSEQVENNTKKEFGDYHAKAIDEVWYKSAVLYYQENNESFVYSVPFDSQNPDELLVTASYAIFPNKTKNSAPGSVVGFQFAHKNLKQRVMELTSRVTNECSECGTCNTTLECYIIDNNGYVIISENDNHTGQFFGAIEGDIMNSLIDNSIFETVRVYDYQTMCDKNDDDLESSANRMTNPLDYFIYIVNWSILKLAWFALEMNIYHILSPISIYAQEIALNDNGTAASNNTEPEVTYDEDDDEDIEELLAEEENEQKWLEEHYACDKQRHLFIMSTDPQQESITNNDQLSRPYYIKKILHSNLLFIAINSTMPLVNQIKYTALPQRIVYENETVYPCQKLGLNNLTRRRLKGCFNEDPLEKEITVCGRSSTRKPLDFFIFLLFHILVVILNK